MNANAVRKEDDNSFVISQSDLVAKVETIFIKNLKGLAGEIVNHQAWQVVGDFCCYMEYGGFCLPGQQITKSRRARSLSHSYRVDRKDLLAASKALRKALKCVELLNRDPGAWSEFQRRLWESVSSEEAKQVRRDLFILQALSGLEMISKAVETMYDEGTLFKRSRWILPKSRRAIISRLAYLFEMSRNPDKVTAASAAMQNLVDTMTKTYDWGIGRKTPGNIFVQFVKDVFEALGLTDTSEDGTLSGTTIRKDMLTAIRGSKEIPQ